MKKILFFFLFFLLLLTGSCSDHRVQMVWLAEMNSLMEKNPQAAYDSLCNHRQDMSQSGEKVEMRYRMLEAKALNKLFKPMPSDSLFQEVVDYYDSKGTPNEKMEAHYLLGCIYRDMKEAPKAMQCYQDAVESVDTLSKDCDFSSLYRIYGQMADVFVKQNLFQEAQIAQQKYRTYALKAKDTLNYIIGSERFIPIYSAMGDTAKAIAQTKLCARLYEKYHYHQKAIAVCVTLIEFYLDRHQYQEAHHLMQKFESKSGLFDKHGNIATPREYYYYYKGKYLLGTQQLDSAEFYFRKLGRFGYSYEASRGLMDVYVKRHNTDSITKYTILAGVGMDSVLETNKTNALEQSSSMYNYSNLQRESVVNLERANREEKKVLLLGSSLLVLFGVLLWLYKKYKKNERKKKKDLEIHQKEIDKWNDNFLQVCQKLEVYKNELETLQKDKKLLADQMQQQIEALQDEITEYKKMRVRMEPSENIATLDEENVYKRFRELTSGKMNTPPPTEEEWQELSLVVSKYFPFIYNKMCNCEKLSQLEMRVCILTRLRFTNKEMTILLNSSASSISNIRQKVNERLFGEKSSKTLFDNMVNL